MTVQNSISEHLGLLLTLLEQQGATIRELSRTIEKIRAEQAGLSVRVMAAETAAGCALRRDGIHVLAADIAAETGIPAATILGPRREKHITQARQAVMYLASLKGHSLSEIGRAVDRDHTTVMHGIRAHKARLAGLQ